MIFNIKHTKKDNEMTTDSNHLMVKMVTSYSLFLFIILLLSINLYLITSNNMKKQFNEQNKAMLDSSIQSMDKVFDIMDVFCRQLLQANDFTRLS